MERIKMIGGVLMTNKQKRLQRDNMKAQRKQKYLTPSEREYGTEEDFKRELMLGNYMMWKMAKDLGVTREDLESPSKCCYAVWGEVCRGVMEGMKGES